MGTHGKSPIQVVVAPDRLKAWVRCGAESEASEISRQMIVDAVREAKIAWNQGIEARVDDLFRALRSENPPTDDWLIAEGKEPVEPVDAQFEWAERFQTDREVSQTDRVDHYERHGIITVAAGEVIGTISPAKQGEAGLDVYGNEVPVQGRPKEILLRDNVELDEDGQTVRATSDGIVHLEDNKLWVTPIIEIDGDVDFSIGNIDASSDVAIRGSVLDLFCVKTTKSITVGRDVEAATLEAAGDIEIHGGVQGREKAHFKAGGNVKVKICDAAKIEAGGDVVITKECINSTVRAGGKVLARSGTFIGGHVHARNGVEVHTIGSPANVRTLITLGTPTEVIEKAQEMQTEVKERTAAAEQIRMTVEPLLREMRRLSPQQKERATELIFQADQIEAGVEELKQQREQILKEHTPDGEPYVLIQGRIFPNVTVVISGRMTTIRSEFKGPLKILRRKVEGVTQLVLVDEISGSSSILKTTRSSTEAEKQAVGYREGRAASAAPTPAKT